MSDMSIYGPHSAGSLYGTIEITMLFTRAGKLVWKFGVSHVYHSLSQLSLQRENTVLHLYARANKY